MLWAKVKRGLSAGRVQSVALRIICDREEEIEAFIPQEYYTLDVILDNLDTKKQLVAKFYGDKNGKLDIGDKASLDKIMDELQTATYQVDNIKTGKREKKAPLPFTTSTLQQEASKALNFSIQKQCVSHSSYTEGVDVKGAGTVGLITYLRTDSAEYRMKQRAQQFPLFQKTMAKIICRRCSKSKGEWNKGTGCT